MAFFTNVYDVNRLCVQFQQFILLLCDCGYVCKSSELTFALQYIYYFIVGSIFIELTKRNLYSTHPV